MDNPTVSAIDNEVWEKYRQRARGADFAASEDAALAAEAELAAALAEAELAAALAAASIRSADVQNSPRSDSTNPLDVSDLSPDITGGDVLLKNHWQDKGLPGTQQNAQGEMPKEQERHEEKYEQSRSEDEVPAKGTPAPYQEQCQERYQEQQQYQEQQRSFKPKPRRSMSSSILAKVRVFEAAAQEQAPARRPQRGSSVVRDCAARTEGRVTGWEDSLPSRRTMEPAKALARVPTSQAQAQAARRQQQERAPAAVRDRAARLGIDGNGELSRTPLDRTPGWDRPELNWTPFDRTPGWERPELSRPPPTRAPLHRTPRWDKPELNRTPFDRTPGWVIKPELSRPPPTRPPRMFG